MFLDRRGTRLLSLSADRQRGQGRPVGGRYNGRRTDPPTSRSYATGGYKAFGSGQRLMRKAGSAIQVIVAVLGWLLFGAAWWWAFSHRGPAGQQLGDLAVVAVFSLAVVVATGAWVKWNVHVYKRGDRRVGVPVGIHDYSVDATGRPVIANLAELRTERVVVIDVIDGEKLYTAGSPVRTEQEVAACEI